ncbi:hypothetical protein JCM9533A_50600 [Catenuloplanes niger JCM 9533]
MIRVIARTGAVHVRERPPECPLPPAVGLFRSTIRFTPSSYPAWTLRAGGAGGRDAGEGGGAGWTGRFGGWGVRIGPPGAKGAGLGL